MLDVTGLTMKFGGLTAVNALSFQARAGEITSVIGPNGAGKTTLFNLISGLVAPSAGTITLDGIAITTCPANERATLGLGRTFQNIRVFGAMTVLENALTGLHARPVPGLGATLLRLPSFRRHERAAVAQARAALVQVGLQDRADLPAGALPYGDQRRLEIARAMAAAPRLLLLDEPAAGLNPAETTALAVLVRQLRDAGTTILLVEHDMGFVMDISDVVTVLNFGRRIFEGPPAAVRQEPVVIEAYLGPKVAARLAAGQKVGRGV